LIRNIKDLKKLIEIMAQNSVTDLSVDGIMILRSGSSVSAQNTSLSPLNPSVSKAPGSSMNSDIGTLPEPPSLSPEDLEYAIYNMSNM
jgi:hypothetical protein